jgi:hypothetical protein
VSRSNPNQTGNIMIIKLSKEEITEAILEWTNKQMDFDYQEHKLNMVEMHYDGCEVSWAKPAEPEVT